MTDEKLKEFTRRLRADGLEPNFDYSGAGTVHSGERSVFITDEGEIHYKSPDRELAFRVRDLRDEVDEYMTAFLAAAPEKREKAITETRTLILYNGAELAARWSERYGVDFATWRLDRHGEREIGYYFNDYKSAKRDFAVRAGLIERERLFTETELTVIRSNLSNYLTIDGGDRISWEQEKEIKDVIDKIDRVIVPELEEQGADEQGFEQEPDL